MRHSTGPILHIELEPAQHAPDRDISLAYAVQCGHAAVMTRRKNGFCERNTRTYNVRQCHYGAQSCPCTTNRVIDEIPTQEWLKANQPRYVMQKFLVLQGLQDVRSCRPNPADADERCGCFGSDRVMSHWLSR